MLEKHIEDVLKDEIKKLNLPCCEIVGSWGLADDCDNDHDHDETSQSDEENGGVKGLQDFPSTISIGISASLHSMPNYTVPRVENDVTIEVKVYPDRCPDGFSVLEAARRISNLFTHWHCHHSVARLAFDDEFYSLDGILSNGGSALTYDEQESAFSFSFNLSLTGSLRQF